VRLTPTRVKGGGGGGVDQGGRVRWWGGTLAVLATVGRWAVGGVRGAENTDRRRKPRVAIGA
jgi:hypothetical protein